MNRPLAKEVTRAAISPNGKMAVLVHRKASGSGTQIASSDAYTLLDLPSGFVKLMLTAHAPTQLVFTDDSAELYVLLPDPFTDADHEIHRIRASSLAVTPYPTVDAPIFVGVLSEAHKAAVMLDNPTGWLTFIDTDTGKVDHVNSFELNSFIQ